MSLAEIQKAEREKRAQDAVIQMQRLQEQEILQQKEQEKIVSGIQLNWAKKPMEPRKQLAESRLQKEKEPPQVVTNTSSSIWNGQNLTWATASAQSTQWSATSVAVAGFWEPSHCVEEQLDEQFPTAAAAAASSKTEATAAAG
nr:unnamed protein product [Callosobruchus chinensis]